MYWVKTQPIWIGQQALNDSVKNTLPETNKKIIDFIENNGEKLAPKYDDVVCTEFVIRVISPFQQLTKSEKKKVRIITTDALVPLIENKDIIIRGVQNALISSDKGVSVNAEEVKPGDFVQFWNVTDGKAYGHCGIVSSITPNKSLTLYSSHPMTNGYGIQKFLWPDYTFFVRLNP
jgi:hypothetical protein